MTAKMCFVTCFSKIVLKYSKARFPLYPFVSKRIGEHAIESRVKDSYTHRTDEGTLSKPCTLVAIYKSIIAALF